MVPPYFLRIQQQTKETFLKTHLSVIYNTQMIKTRISLLHRARNGARSPADVTLFSDQLRKTKLIPDIEERLSLKLQTLTHKPHIVIPHLQCEQATQ